MIYKKIIFWLLGMYSFIGNIQAQYNEKYRPQYHFSPKKGWVGDPDGLVYYKGLYHLFWWGHAVSKDLVHWQELPYPMKGGDRSFSYFSGSVVVDTKNTAGFGDSSMIAVYTIHKNDSVPEYQGLSTSSNDGLSFDFYKNNPVLDIGSTSFRDPQVFWHTPTHRWIMAAARPKKHQVGFYASQDLKTWQFLSDFGPVGAHSSDWEVPDLFELPIDGDVNNKKWVLTIGQGPNKMQYFIGSFDGTSFVTDKRKEDVLWIDYGTDYYAARTWRNIDDITSNRTTMLAWMGNWDYAGKVPTKWGKGFESLPREVALKTFEQGVRMVQSPVQELTMLRGDSISFTNKKINGTQEINEFKPRKNVYELEAEINLKNATETGFNLLEGDGRKLVVGYDAKAQQLYIDRTNCTDFVTDTVFTNCFAKKMTAPLSIRNGQLKLHIFIDQASVEVFANDGEISMSATTFPAENQTGISAFSIGNSNIKSFKSWMLNSIWNKQ